jgi:hypothetical protein
MSEYPNHKMKLEDAAPDIKVRCKPILFFASLFNLPSVSCVRG